MSFKEIKELRKNGKLEEALEMANEALQAEPDNIWNKRAAGWVYYDYLKNYSELDSYDRFKENLIKIKDLQLPEDEKMVFDNSAWQIGSMIFNLQKQQNVDYGKINELLDIIMGFHFTKPSESYTFVYKAFHKGYQKWSRYIEFTDWWGIENFRSEDYLKETFKDKKLMSVAEQAYIAYSKKLLDSNTYDKEKILAFIPHLDKVIDEHPEYQYPPYYKAKLLLALGDEENILSSFLPFARMKRNDFWVWEVLAEIFTDNIDIQISCFCKALSLKTPEDFLVKIRLAFARLLIRDKKYSEAKIEIDKIVETRSKNGWKISLELIEWMGSDWYTEVNSTGDNSGFYSQHLNRAEEILYQDIQEETIAVEFVNRDKGMLHFIKDNKELGFFKYHGFIKKPKVGDVLAVRFNGNEKNRFYKIFTCVISKTESPVIQSFNGEFKKVVSKNFGFVNDVFVEPRLIEKLNLEHGQLIIGKAIMSFNKKKNQWGWKAFEIQKA